MNGGPGRSQRIDGLPNSVRIYEVGPRDGLQNEPVVVPTAKKAEFIHRLVAAGLSTVEATSFVSPGWVPQLSDADALFGVIDKPEGIRFPVLVPNMKGLHRAIEAGATDVAVFASATESFAKRNLNRTVNEALAMFEPVVATARDNGMWVRGYVSMCFGDPWEGDVPASQVVAVCDRLTAMGCDELSIGDTTGVATPGQVHHLLSLLEDTGIRGRQVAVHFHDTYGQALANTLAALEAGVTTVDSSAGGLGGCPYAKSATGNLATEDLVWMLDGLGIDCGVDLTALVAASVWMAGELGRPSPSRVVAALGSGRGSADSADGKIDSGTAREP
jgi:hydroxymethylglutaryl-CoA lyase